MKKDQSNPAERLVDAMLALVAEHGWGGIKIEAVAERAGLSWKEAYGLCPDRAHLLNMFARWVDLESVADAGSVPEAFEARYDQLLDILMLRFETLNPHRKIVSQILTDATREPDTLLGVLPQSQRSFAFLAGAAGFPHTGWQGVVFAKALSAVWLSAQRVWLDDESPDLSETMAALDRNLRRALDLLDPIFGRSLGSVNTVGKD
jgi:AcrR family transcriptional regulator